MTGSEPRNEDEGNRTVGRWYKGAQHRFVQSGQVEEEAHEGRKGDGSSEKRGMERAEKIGKRHITREVRNSPESNSSHRPFLQGGRIAMAVFGFRPPVRSTTYGNTCPTR